MRAVQEFPLPARGTAPGSFDYRQREFDHHDDRGAADDLPSARAAGRRADAHPELVVAIAATIGIGAWGLGAARSGKGP